MRSVMHAFSNRVEVLRNITPFVQLQQTAVLSDGVVFEYPPSLHQPISYSFALSDLVHNVLFAISSDINNQTVLYSL